MKNENVRFVVIMDPVDLWTVWDEELDQPADFFGTSLVGMPEKEAESACYLLNELYIRLSAEKGDEAA